MNKLFVFFTVLLLSCNQTDKIDQKTNDPPKNIITSPYVIVLGTAQDAGYPQIGCKKECCKEAWTNPLIESKYTSCIAIVDPENKQQWIIDATPDIKYQINLLEKESAIEGLDGVLITHAHIGHYSGLMHFGKEAMGSDTLPVYCVRKMKSFLENNGPWSQLVKLKNISIKEIIVDSTFNLNKNIQIQSFLVPHRDEYSETVGYKIIIKDKSLVFIPDIDKWEKWDQDIINVIKENTFALLDGTFYQNGEIARDMSEIPHPFVSESMQKFSILSDSLKQRVHFIHLNHTNPLLIEGSTAQKKVYENGFNIANQKQVFTFN